MFNNLGKQNHVRCSLPPNMIVNKNFGIFPGDVFQKVISLIKILKLYQINVFPVFKLF